MSEKENKMREIRLEKVTINIGVGEPGEKLEKAYTLLERITGMKPVKTKAKKRLPEFHIRPGLEIGVKVDLRGKKAEELLNKLLDAVERKIKESSFADGYFSFGIKEYIYIPGVKYDPRLGIFGMDVCVTLERPGFRVKRRTYRRSKVGKKHMITKEDTIKFAKEKFNVVVE